MTEPTPAQPPFRLRGWLGKNPLIIPLNNREEAEEAWGIARTAIDRNPGQGWWITLSAPPICIALYPNG